MQPREALRSLWADEAAVTATEYALLLATVALTAAIAFGSHTDQVNAIADRTSVELARIFGMGCR